MSLLEMSKILCMTPKHQIWCNFNIKFGAIVGDALRRKSYARELLRER